MINTPFGAASPVVVGGVVLGAVIGLTIALDDNGDSDEARGATGAGGTGAGGTSRRNSYRNSRSGGLWPPLLV